MKNFITLICCAIIIGGCSKKSKNSNDGQPPVDSVYSESTGLCSNGQINGKIGQCGNLADVDLCGHEFEEGFDFRGSYFDNVDFCKKSFVKAMFQDTRIENSNLSETDLSSANFEESQVRYSKFSSANLSDSKWIGVYTTDNDFDNANLKAAKFYVSYYRSRGGYNITTLVQSNNVSGALIDSETQLDVDLYDAVNIYDAKFHKEASSKGSIFVGKKKLGIIVGQSGSNGLSDLENSFIEDLFNKFIAFNSKITISKDHPLVQITKISKFSDLVDIVDEGISHLLSENSAGFFAANYASNSIREVTGESFASFNIDSNIDSNSDDIDSLSVQPVTLSGAYLGEKGYSAMDRMGTLLHESMHSRCPFVPTKSEAEKIDDVGERDNLTDKELSCFNKHVDCVHNPDIKGRKKACDRHKWGAYAMSWAINDLVAKNCEKCSELEIQTYKAYALERLSRVEKAEEMLGEKIPI